MADVYVLEAKVEIGRVLLNAVHSVVINRSVQSLSDTATLQIPRHIAALETKESLLDILSIGDEIRIDLGYNEQVFTEFTGYVKNISNQDLVSIECEDEMYKLRKMSLEPKHYKKVQLSQLVRDIMSGKEVDIDYDFEVQNYRIPSGTSVYEVLSHLKENFPVDFYFREGILRSRWNYSLLSSDTKVYHLERNVAKNDLKYIVSEKKEQRLRAVSTLKNGKRLQVEWGAKDAPLRTLHFAYIESESELLTIAKAEYQKRKFAGYKGTITGFGFPLTECGQALEIQSEEYPDKQGKYFIDKLTIRFSKNGYRRENEISKKILDNSS